MVDALLIAYVALPIILLLLEKPLGLITRLTDYLNSMWVFRPGFTLYKLFSYFLIVGFWAYFGLYLPNILALHENLITAFYTNGHYLSWLALMTVITVFGYFNIVKGIYAAALIYSIHELAWLFFDGLALNQMGPLFIHFWPLVAVLGFLGLGYFVAYRSLPTWKEIAIVVSVIWFDVAWYVLDGWKVAVQNFNATTPKTIYFNDPTVNLIEVLSWVLPAFIVLFRTPKTIRDLIANVAVLGLIGLGLTIGVLGLDSSWVEVEAPMFALLIVYALIMIWPLYDDNPEDRTLEETPNAENQPKALYITSKGAMRGSKRWVIQKCGKSKSRQALEELVTEVRDPEWCNLP